MRKAAIVGVAAVLGLVVALGAASYWLGIRARQTYTRLLQQIASNGGFSVSGLHFQNGWLSSTATAALTPPGFPARISIVSRIHFGPLPELAHQNFMPGMAVVSTRISVLAAALPGMQPVTAHTMIYLAGNSVTSLNIPAYRRVASGGEGFSWGPATGKITVAADQQTVLGNIAFPQVQVSGFKDRLALSGADLRWSHLSGISGPGRMTLSVQRVGNSGQKRPFTIEGLRVALSDLRHGGKIAANISMHVRMWNDGISSYGPGQLLLQMTNLDGASFDRFAQGLRTLVRRQLPPNRRSAEMRTRTTELLQALARKNAKITVRSLEIKAAGAQVIGKGRFVLNATNAGGSTYPEMLLGATTGSAELLVPRSVVANLATDEIRQQLDQYKSDGTLTPTEAGQLTRKRVRAIVRNALPMYMNRVASRWHLVSAGADYMLTATVRQDKLFINGQPAGPGETGH